MDYAEIFCRVEGDIILKEGEPQICYDREDEERVLDQIEDAGVESQILDLPLEFTMDNSSVSIMARK
jgi:hypothetical protein